MTIIFSIFFPLVRDCCSSNYGYSLSFYSTRIRFALANSSFVYLSSSKNDIATGDTYHIVATYDMKTMKIYVNGILSSQTENNRGIGSAANIPSYHSLEIGRMGLPIGDGGKYYHSNDGTQYLIKMYDQALTEEQVLQSFNNTKSRFGM